MAKKIDPTFTKPIGERLKRAREARDLTRTAMAAKLSIAARNWAKYEDGEMAMGAAFLMRTAEVCEVSIDWIVRGHQDLPPTAFFLWLESKMGAAAAASDGVLVRGMRELPLDGYQPSAAFYDELYDGLRSQDLAGSPEDTVRQVRETLRERQS